MVDGEKTVLTAAGALKDTRFWCPEDPYLYDVYTILTVDGKTVDVNKLVTGFRKTAFRGGAGTGGVYLNDKFIYLKGFAQRSSNEWAGLGGAYPDWVHDVTAQLLRDSHGNYMRWMHIAPQPADADSFDRFGIIQICPGGDKERDAVGRQWEQRVEVMRDSMIYFRNNPSILFWEAGNTVITVAHMQQMVALRKQWDPDGGRVIGARGNDNVELNTAITPIAEFYGIMVGQDPRTDQLSSPTDMFRGYSAVRRDRAPLIETEAFEMKARAASGTIFRRRISVSRRDPTTRGNTPPRASLWPRSPAIALIGITAFPTPTRLTPGGRVMPPFISPIPTPMDARIRARSAGSAAKWMPFVCPRRFISPTVSCRTSSPIFISWVIGVIRRRP